VSAGDRPPASGPGREAAAGPGAREGADGASPGDLGHPADLDAFRRQVEAVVAPLLEAREAGFRVPVMGAGADDLAPGRHFLRLLAEGGFAVPTWPREQGGWVCRKNGPTSWPRCSAASRHRTATRSSSAST
jgi:alkylation response protein AidB-like acyl-CoA dehydrogenase